MLYYALALVQPPDVLHLVPAEPASKEKPLLRLAQAAQRVPVQHARRRDGIAGLGERLPEIGPGEMARAH